MQDTREWLNIYSPKFPNELFLQTIEPGINFPLIMNYKADTRQETQDRRREGLWSNVLSPKSANEVFLQTMGPGIDFPLIMQYSAVEQKSSSAEEQKNRSAEVQQGSRLEAQSPFTVHLLRSRTNYFYFLNGHGDVTYFADENFTQEQIETYEYTPWGVLLTSASKNNLLYTAREFDFDTGLQFNRIRYYNANLGRFIYKDKFKTLNSFCYASNSPLNFIDPFGYSIFMTCFIGPFFPPCSGWQWVSYGECMGFCAAMTSYFQSLCAQELNDCIDNCADFDYDCLEECHNNYFLCMIATTAIYCYCAMECQAICSEEYIDIDFDVSIK